VSAGPERPVEPSASNAAGATGGSVALRAGPRI